MIDSRQLNLFVALAEDLHFARSADRLGIAPSVLSQQIKRLESDLGVRLLNRNKRAAITLTDAGNLFLVEAKVALRQIERADRIGRLAARGEAGHVALGYIGSAVATGLLPDTLKVFRVASPDVRMHILAMETPTQLERLADGAIDVGFIRPRAHYPDGVTAKVVQSEPLLIALPADSSLARVKAVKASSYAGCHSLRRSLMRQLVSQKISPDSAASVGSMRNRSIGSTISLPRSAWLRRAMA